MPKSTATSIHDLATRAHTLRSRIRADERALAIAYPADVEGLERNLETWRAQLAELEPQLEEAKEAVANDLREAVDRCFEARALLYRLNGHLVDQGFADGIFASMHLGGSPQSVEGVKAALLRVIDLEPFEYPEVPDHQRQHEERLRNERAGHGYYTDAELAEKGRDPARFHGGDGARVLRRQPVPEEGYKPPAQKRVQFFR